MAVFQKRSNFQPVIWDGRQAPGGDAVSLIEIDGELPPEVLKKVQALPQVRQAKPLKF